MKNSILYAVAFLAVSLTTSGTATAATVLGIDVSANQGSVNWSSAHGSGIQFAYAKATEGTTSQDAFFHANMDNGRAAGVYMGAYEFSRPDLNTPSAEANYFWNFAGGSIGAGGFNIMPAVALEVFNGHVGASSYTAWINAWCTDVKAKTSHFLHPVISIGACDACNLSLRPVPTRGSSIPPCPSAVARGPVAQAARFGGRMFGTSGSLPTRCTLAVSPATVMEINLTAPCPICCLYSRYIKTAPHDRGFGFPAGSSLPTFV